MPSYVCVEHISSGSYVECIVKERVFFQSLSICYPISNAVISLCSKENLCYHTEICPDLDGFYFFYFLFLFSKMTIGMNVYVRNTTYNGWKNKF